MEEDTIEEEVKEEEQDVAEPTMEDVNAKRKAVSTANARLRKYKNKWRNWKISTKESRLGKLLARTKEKRQVQLNMRRKTKRWTSTPATSTDSESTMSTSTISEARDTTMRSHMDTKPSQDDLEAKLKHSIRMRLEEMRTAEPEVTMEEGSVEDIIGRMMQKEKEKEEAARRQKNEITAILNDIIGRIEAEERDWEENETIHTTAIANEITNVILSSNTSQSADELGMSEQELKTIILEEAKQRRYWTELMDEAESDEIDVRDKKQKPNQTKN